MEDENSVVEPMSRMEKRNRPVVNRGLPSATIPSIAQHPAQSGPECETMEAAAGRAHDDHVKSRKERKEEGKRLKRQRIETSGGVRPRTIHDATTFPKNDQKHNEQTRPESLRKMVQRDNSRKHRFGRVMDEPPRLGKPRVSTLSIAIPGSIVSNAQTRELKTYLVSQIARAATIYHVDEIVVFDDKLSVEKRRFHDHRQRRNPQKEGATTSTTDDSPPATVDKDAKDRPLTPSLSDPHTFMARVLQYCECPQYLRRNFFPMHPDLQFVGLIPPTDAPHHVRAEDCSKYREGVVLDKYAPRTGNSLVNCGIRNRPVEIDARLKPGVRCTVRLDPACQDAPGPIHGTVVSPAAPRLEDGTYWGYTTRLAGSLQKVFQECPFDGGYDLKIGTSERGSETVEGKNYVVPEYRHAVIVFGGVAGIEECVDADESIMLPGLRSHTLFDQWLNICPFQGSRTIRTEEAVMIALAKLGSVLQAKAHSGGAHLCDGPGGVAPIEVKTKIDVSGEDVSEESSDDSDA